MVIYYSHVHKEFPASFDIETLVSVLQAAELFFSSKCVIWGTMANIAFGVTWSALVYWEIIGSIRFYK